ncbi:MAG: GNAT family N-acetyltransferase [Pseudomonadota bacterium]
MPRKTVEDTKNDRSISLAAPDIALRPARPEDAPFACAVQCESIRPYREAYFGWSEAREQQEFYQEWDAAQVTIVERESQPVGWFYLAQRRAYWALNRFHIAKSARRQGVGAAVLRLITARAGFHKTPVILQVYKNNPARTLYERFGFFVIHEDHHQFHMRRDAPSAGDSDWTRWLRSPGGSQKL